MTKKNRVLGLSWTIVREQRLSANNFMIVHEKWNSWTNYKILLEFQIFLDNCKNSWTNLKIHWKFWNIRKFCGQPQKLMVNRFPRTVVHERPKTRKILMQIAFFLVKNFFKPGKHEIFPGKVVAKNSNFKISQLNSRYFPWM